MTQHQQLAVALERLESSMRAGDLWKQEPPPEEAFESSEPFCIDTMTLPQWLRFVLCARLRESLEQGSALPQQSQIAPAAELQLQGLSTGRRLPVLESLHDIDHVLNTGHLREQASS
ncbi:YqcC family protein [Kushneria phosphatilytica]|uniref:YqcC family protein n=1 Tax=Kushneria phosphatilytica TaxID=657387 RepID=A0A1S1NUA7_9GAMM|nr:YqcC family protein [Kushneria phosphatilytica]OHV09949.1 hypothetical protein BH688_10045 [Kushneria phosphatilytica]QEL11627.1 YqcC family protein [Kushneria phosphatilytica]